MAIVVRIRGESMAPGQREGGRGRQGGAVAAVGGGDDVVVVAATVAVAGQHHVPNLLLDVVKTAHLQLAAARAAGGRARGGAQLEG